MAKKTTAADLEAIANNYSGTLDFAPEDKGNPVSRSFGGLKDVGGTVLDALTVPVSAALTARQNAAVGINKILPGNIGQYIAPTLGSKETISWKNALGNFSNTGGVSGYDASIKALSGTDNKWVNLYVGIAADPLWFLGGGVVNSAAKGAKAAETAIKAADKAADVGKAVKSGRTIESVRAVDAIDRIRLAKALTAPVNTSSKLKLTKALGYGKDVKLGKIKLAKALTATGITSATKIKLAKAITAPAKGFETAATKVLQQAPEIDKLKLAKALSIDSNKLTKIQLAKAMAGGDLPRANKLRMAAAFGRPAEQAVPAAKAPKTLEPLTAAPSEGMQLAERVAQNADTPLREAVHGAGVQNASGFANPERLQTQMRKLKEGAIREYATPRKAYMYLGTGKSHVRISPYVTVPWAKKGLAGTRAGTFFLTPAQRVAHALNRAKGEVIDRTDIAVLNIAAKHGLAAPDAKGVMKLNDKPSVMLGVYRQLRSLTPEGAENLKAVMQEKGLWDEGLDGMTDYLTTRYAEQASVKFADNEPYVNSLIEKLAKAEERAAKTEAKADIGKVEELRQRLRAVERNQKNLFEPRASNTAQRAAETAARREAIREGRDSSIYSAIRKTEDKDFILDDLENPFAVTSMERFLIDMQDIAKLTPEQAGDVALAVDDALKAAGLKGFAKEQGALVPEWNALTTLGLYENKIVIEQVNKQIEDLLELVLTEQRAAGIKIADDATSQVAGAIKYGVNPYSPGRLMHTSEIGRWMTEKGVPRLKAFMTVLNPISHFSSNAYGDFMNALITGNWRHATKGVTGSMPKTKLWELAKATMRHSDDAAKLDARAMKALDDVYEIGGQQYSGWELDMLSRMVGLGRGYHTTDIADMLHMFGVGPSSHQGKFERMTGPFVRLQANRENAQRVSTWINHMHAGDDPITAGFKTVRVHFDYNELTDFEKLWMRNILLFYTWAKRNPLLQAQGIATRPALYNTNAALESTRNPIEFEPDYYREQGLFGAPGLQGGIGLIGNTQTDIHKFELSFDNFRRNSLGMVNPVIRVPAEVMMNKSAFTGGPVERYPDENRPSSIARLLDAIGVPVPQSRSHQGGERLPALPAWLDYSLRQFQGPVATSVGNITDPENEGAGMSEILKRVTGIQTQANKPDKFERSYKAREAKKKADKTRKRNAEAP